MFSISPRVSLHSRWFLKHTRSKDMASNDASDQKMKRSAAEDVGKTEASIARYNLRGQPRSSRKAVNNDTANAANACQENLCEEHIQKRDMIRSPVLKPKEAAGVNYVQLSGQQLIGRKVKIWWPKEEMFVRGKIISFNEEGRTHLVHYHNDIMEVIDLSEEHWQLIKEKDPGPGPSNAMTRSVGMETSHTSKRRVTEAMTREDRGKDKKVIKTEFNSNEDEAVHPKAALAGSKMAGARCELVSVDGYQVNASIAHTLQSIFSKHGDIARYCKCQIPRVRSVYLEEVCEVVEKLRSTKFGVTSSQLREMIAVISEAAKANLYVSWLQRFLEGINPGDDVATELRASSYRVVEAARKDVEDWQRGLMEVEKRWRALDCVHAKMESDDVAAAQAWKRSLDQLL